MEWLLRNAVFPLGSGPREGQVELGRSWVFLWTCHQLPPRWEFALEGRVSRKRQTMNEGRNDGAGMGQVRSGQFGHFGAGSTRPHHSTAFLFFWRDGERRALSGTNLTCHRCRVGRCLSLASSPGFMLSFHSLPLLQVHKVKVHGQSKIAVSKYRLLAERTTNRHSKIRSPWEIDPRLFRGPYPADLTASTQ